MAALLLLASDACAQLRDDFSGAALDSSVWTADAGSGQVAVANGALSLNGPGPTFPVVLTRSDRFPPGDFIVRVGMQYTSQGFCGDGFGALDNFWEDYYGTACRPFLLWQDNGGLYVYAGSSGPTSLAPPADLGYHVYEVAYIGGQYSFSMDGVLRASGGCAPRATRLFFGHPHPISCGGPWSSLAVDFVEITSAGATAIAGGTWGAMKLRYH